ncbi:MAG: EamA family transporter [Candidatus Muiribacteriaceae bacterium]
MLTAYLALTGRIILLGYERIVVKRLGSSKSGGGAGFMLFFTALFFFIPFLFTAEWPQDPGVYLKISLCAIIYSVTFSLYVLSLSIGEISLVGPLYNFNVFFLLIISYLFLGESIGIMKIAGILLLLYGASFLSRQGSLFRSLLFLFKDKACFLMIIFSCLLAVGRVADKYLVRDIDPVVYAFVLYAQMTAFLYIFNVLCGRGKTVFKLFRENPKDCAIAGAINAFSYLFLLYALKEIEVSVAEPANMLSMVISLILAYFIFREKVGKRAMGVVIMMIGAWLLFI